MLRFFSFLAASFLAGLSLKAQALILLDATPSTSENKKAFTVIEKLNSCLGVDAKKVKKCTSGLFASELSSNEKKMLLQWMAYPIQISLLKNCTTQELKYFKSPRKPQLTLCSSGKGIGEDSAVIFAFKKQGKNYQLLNIKP